MAKDAGDGWGEHRLHVMAELKRISGRIEQLFDCYNGLRSDVAMLKVKAGVWGLLGASIPIAIATVVVAVLKG